MAKFCTLTPAYGRDYRSRKQIFDDLNLNKDFILHDVTSPWDGKPCDLRGLRDQGYTHLQVRYRQQRAVAMFKVADFVL